ncbi:MAG TPA: MFS transporter [Bauldia sp.]|nr:MFS transporter [Bauldia sp.]
MYPTLRPIFSLLLGLFFLIVGHGLQLTLVPLRAEAEGWSAFQIGAIGSAYYVGFLAGCVGTPYLILRAGHIRAFMALASAIAAAIVAHPLWVAFVPWIVLRLIVGASLAGLYMIIESWLNERASNENRGLIMSIYIMVNYGALAVGQFMVTQAPPTAFTLFALATVSMALASIPLALTRQQQPAPVALVRFRPQVVYRAAPVGLVGVFGSGLANGAYWSLGAVAAVAHGMSTSNAALFLTIATLSGTFAQWPVGRLSDRMDRRYVLVALLGGAIVFGLVLALVPLTALGWYIVAVPYGFAIAPIYSISAAHAYDRVPKGTMVETAASLFIASAIGSIVGPLIASTMMQHLGGATLFLYTAVIYAALAAYVVIRLQQRPRQQDDPKTDFQRSAAVPGGGTIAPEPLDPNDPNVATPPPSADNIHEDAA